jgi:hypothetical protein
MEPVATGPEVKTPVDIQKDEHSLETPVMDSAEVMSCAKVFGLESEKISPKEKQMLEECFKWAKSETKEDGDVNWTLISKRNQLGTPITGESYLVRMFQWVRQYMIIKEEEKKLKEMEFGEPNNE